ncbi:MAG: PIN domain-containing protein [Candidatus Omnitrophica bacterium]|nr:PIN domain-containing protein [Candidatus Omnitrophota bacterium]
MGQILVDTSAWIEFFRHAKSPLGQAVDLLLGEGQVCTTGLVIVEVVSGARDRSQFNRLSDDFAALPRVDPPPALWEEMLQARRRLRTAGITGISIPDLIIALTATAHQKIVLTRDRDFQRMQTVLGLKLLELSGSP